LDESDQQALQGRGGEDSARRSEAHAFLESVSAEASVPARPPLRQVTSRVQPWLYAAAILIGNAALAKGNGAGRESLGTAPEQLTTGFTSRPLTLLIALAAL